MVALRLALLYFPFLVTIFLTATTTAQPNFISLSCGYVKGGNSSGSSTYISNLNSLLLNITSDTRIDYGFFNFSSSSGSSSSNSDEKVNVVALCRGDVSVQDCRSCLSNAATLLPRSCSNQKEAIGWYDNCMLRYSNRTIFRTVETSPHFYLWNTEDALEINNFKAVLAEMLRRLRIAASSGNWRRKYATTNATAPRNQTIYGLVQCTPDLSMDDCDTCLGGAISELPKCCNRSKGGRVVRPNCNIRYESYSFFGTPQEAVPPLPPSPPPPPPTPIPQSAPPPTNSSMFQQGKSKSTTRRTIIVIVVPILGFIFLLILIFIYLRLKKPRKYIEGEAHEEIITADSLQFDFESIKVATNDFSEANKLGQGERPSMSSIVPMLDSYTLTLSIPSEPAFYMSSTTNTARGDSEEKSSINERNHLPVREEHGVRIAELPLRLERSVIGLELRELQDLRDGDVLGFDLLLHVVLGEIRIGSVIDDEAELGGFGEKRVRERDFVGIHAVVLGDFLEGENEVEEFVFVFEKLGFLVKRFGISPFQEGFYRLFHGFGINPLGG
ncbi:putative receptor-like protein kinase [Senna tora]|uniref:Putative receptor-like protein kinase n=1 Tax=Senna tora TaxID=362788 RepID=A0A835C8E5_9FABA|nr:putative receptor-like protein kinase [Senna tora]